MWNVFKLTNVLVEDQSFICLLQEANLVRLCSLKAVVELASNNYNFVELKLFVSC